MEDIKRYTLSANRDTNSLTYMRESTSGNWVKYSDYLELKALLETEQKCSSTQID